MLTNRNLSVGIYKIVDSDNNSILGNLLNQQFQIGDLVRVVDVFDDRSNSSEPWGVIELYLLGNPDHRVRLRVLDAYPLPLTDQL